MGAEIFVTAGSATKRQHLIDQYGIPADHVFDTGDLSFAKSIMRITDGNGIDVVLNSLSGESLRKTWECTARFGRFVELGMNDVMGGSGLDTSHFLKSITFTNINMKVNCAIFW